MSSVIVVEGLHDKIKVESVYPEAFIVITNGSEISKDTITLLKRLSVDNAIIVFTDPDSPGERIRCEIENAIPGVFHAFLRKKDCISKNHKKVGIEHASKECIINSLATLYSNKGYKDTIMLADMYEFNLLGMPNSAKLRERIADELNIGRPNGKTFLKRLNMLQIKKEELRKLCQRLEM